MSPKYSIVIPVYNTKSEYLKRAVDSLLSQSYKNFEIIMIDDGSDSKTADYCDSFKQVDSRIIVIHKTNSGQLHSRLVGMGIASGKYLMFLDSDDEFTKDALLTIDNYSKKYDFDLLLFGFDKIRNNTVVSASIEEEKSPLFITDKSVLYKKVLCSSSYNSLWRKVVNRNIISDFDYSAFYYLRNAEDLLQSLQFYKQSQTVVFINDLLYHYRINDESVTQSISLKNIQDSFVVHNTIEDFLKEESVFSDKDYLSYHSFCWRIFANQLYNLSVSTNDISVIYDNLEAISTDPYIKLLSSKKHNNIGLFNSLIVKLFFEHNYSILILISKIYRRIKTCITT